MNYIQDLGDIINLMNLKYFEHKIFLSEGDHFDPKYPNYFSSICKSFCLISYLSNACLVYVLSRKNKNDEKTLFIFKKLKNGLKRYNGNLTVIKRHQRDENSYIIKCVLQIQEQGKIDSKIEEKIEVVLEKKEQIKGREKRKRSIKITIKQQFEQKSLLNQSFGYNIQNIQSIRLSPQLRQSQKALTYFFREGIQDRKAQADTPHLFLAFGWGGIQSIGFIGVLNILKKNIQRIKKQQKPNFIRSIICSQFGAIIGLRLILQQLNCKVDSSKQNFEIMEKALKKMLSQSKNEKINNLQQQPLQRVLQLISEQLQLRQNSIFKKFLKKNFKRISPLLAEFLWNFHPTLSQTRAHTSQKQKQKLLLSIFQKSDAYREESIQILKMIKVQGLKQPQSITMKQLYEISKVQYTLTALDLTNRIIRFLNHKTTPDLPVCQAIKITSKSMLSFPRIQWKSQWGKYYVHYDITRVQIDLTNCQMTTGGQVIPYPLNYLDNPTVQTKYFTHKKNEKTSLLGFSLDRDHRNYMNYEQTRNQNIRKCIGKMIGQIKNYLSQSLIGDQIQQSIKQLKEFVKKMIKLPQVLMEAVHNLNLEYFSENTNYIHHHRNFQNHKNPQKEQKSVLQILCPLVSQEQKDHLQCMFKGEEVPKQPTIQKYSQRIIQNLQILQKRLEEHQLLQNDILDYIILLKMVYLPFNKKEIEKTSTGVLKRKLSGEKQSENYISKVQKFRKDTIFWMSQLQQNSQVLKQAIAILKKTMKQKQSQDIIKQIYLEQRQFFYQIVKNSILFTSQQREINQTKFQVANNLQNFLKIIYFIRLSTSNNTNKLSIFQTIQNLSQCLGQRQTIYHDFFCQDRRIRNFYSEIFIRKNLFLPKTKRNQGNKNIHLVLQSSPSSYKYVIPYIQAVQQSLLQHSQKIRKFYRQHQLDKQDIYNPKIRYITASGFNCIPSMLYISKLKSKQLEDAIFSLTSSLKDTKWIQTYRKFAWLMSNKSLFSQKTAVKKSVQQFLLDSLQILRKSEVESHDLNILQEKKGIILQELQYLYNSMFKLIQGDQKALNIKHIQGSYKIFETLIEYLGFDILANFFDSSAFSMEYFNFFYRQSLKAQQSEGQIQDQRLYKAFLCQHLLLTSRIRKYIGDILEKLKLSPDITLQQYSKANSRNIDINISVYEVNSGSIMFLNKETRPKMPVWAAILAGIALPVFFPPCKDQNHWVKTQIQELTLKHAFDKFTQAYGLKKTKLKQFFSGDFLNKLPVQLISNQRVQKANMIKEDSQMICMSVQQAFNIQDIFKRPNKKKPKDMKQFAKKLTKIEDQDWKDNQIIQGLFSFYNSISSPNFKLYSDLYDYQTCYIHSLPFDQLYSSKTQEQKNKIMKFYIQKAQVLTQTHLMNHPLLKNKGRIQLTKLEETDDYCKAQIMLDDQNSKFLQGKTYTKIEKAQELNDGNIKIIMYRLGNQDITNLKKYKLIQPDKQIIVQFKVSKKQQFKLKIKHETSLSQANEQNKQKRINTNYYYHTIVFSFSSLKRLTLNEKYEYLFTCNPEQTMKQFIYQTNGKQLRDSQQSQTSGLVVSSISPRYLACCLDKKQGQQGKYLIEFIYDKKFTETSSLLNKILVSVQKQEKQISLKKQIKFSTSFLQLTDNRKLEYLKFQHQLQMKPQMNQDRLFFKIPYNSQSYTFSKYGLQKYIGLTPILNYKNLSQKQLICPKCFSDKKNLQRVKTDEYQECACCTLLSKKQSSTQVQQSIKKKVLLKCIKCTKCPSYICARCIYLFKDNDKNPYTCPYCSTNITDPIKLRKINQCSQCRLINRSYFEDTKCNYSFCQKCFKNIYVLQK